MRLRGRSFLFACLAFVGLGCQPVDAVQLLAEDTLIEALTSPERAPPLVKTLPEPCIGAGCELPVQAAPRPPQPSCDVCRIEDLRAHVRLHSSFPSVLDAALTVRTERETYVYDLGDVFRGEGAARDFIFETLPLDANALVSATLSLRTEELGTSYAPLSLVSSDAAVVRRLPEPCVGTGCKVARALEPWAGCDVCLLSQERLLIRVQPSFPEWTDVALTVRTERETYVFPLGEVVTPDAQPREFIFEGLSIPTKDIVSARLSFETARFSTDEPVNLPAQHH